MCGIAGVLFHTDETPDQELLSEMGKALRYRGPDDEGYFRGSHISLVHRRLSIRDLSSTGNCPMSDAEGRVWVVFNGEIYNWRELRKELESEGFTFVSQSDTEVILHGYRAWGEALISRLRGMFAIGIWDSGKQILMLARDRMGEKPLFYQVTKKGVTFASTLEALYPASKERRIDPTALACYLTHSFIPSSHVIWQGIQVLPPAHTLSISIGEEPVLNRYWDFPHIVAIRSSARHCLEVVESALEDSVARCLDADVPVGVFLSGGVDSSLVTALAARHYTGLQAFSLGFAEEGYSELRNMSMKMRHRVTEIRLQYFLSEAG